MKLKGVRQRWQTVASDHVGKVEVEVKAEAESDSETAGGGGKGIPVMEKQSSRDVSLVSLDYLRAERPSMAPSAGPRASPCAEQEFGYFGADKQIRVRQMSDGTDRSS